jgi:hypothetical protein
MEYKKGCRVKHPSAPEWGVGEVLEDTTGDSVRVFFVGSGEKKLSLKDLQLEKIDGDASKHPILDNLKLSLEDGLRYRTLPESIQRFLIEYPGGFYGEKFADHERDYKLNTHRLMNESLSKQELHTLLEKDGYEETCRRALKLMNSTNLIFPNEQMAFRDGLESLAIKRRFSEVLYSHLFAEKPLKIRFVELCEFLEEIKAAKWTIATFFLFTMFPDQHMFIKPTITKNSADICHFDIHYRSDLNWQTYEAVLRFAEFLRNALKDLKPRDMIDVQSFMWCIRPDKTLKSFGKKKAKQPVGNESADS